jgi:hypothetical protein
MCVGGLTTAVEVKSSVFHVVEAGKKTTKAVLPGPVWRSVPPAVGCQTVVRENWTVVNAEREKYVVLPGLKMSAVCQPPVWTSLQSVGRLAMVVGPIWIVVNVVLGLFVEEEAPIFVAIQSVSQKPVHLWEWHVGLSMMGVVGYWTVVPVLQVRHVVVVGFPMNAVFQMWMS